ncbi:MAG: uracil-DNA glycosylase family protein [Chloroflexota bacterium]
MRTYQRVRCEHFPCADVRHDVYAVPTIDVKPERVAIVVISEAAPADPNDYYYARGNPLFARTTLQAFNDAGVKVASIKDLLQRGVYLTTAVKCAKTGYGIETSTVKECARLLEQELALFPNARAYLLMGDVAIKSLNYIAARAGEARVIPAGSTYKIRGQKYFFHGARAFPSYLQAGPSFFIEKSKRKMIAQDIAGAMRLIK